MSAGDPDREAIARRPKRRWGGRLDGLVVGVAILAAWELGVRLGGVPVYLLPPPSIIAARLFTDWRAIALHTAVTTSEILIGFLLSIVVSIPLAALLAQSRAVERALYPVLVASQTVPKVAIAPLLVVWFGFGLAPKVVIAFLVCFFPILIDAMIGFRSTPKEVLWLARSMGTSRWKTFVHFQIPAALPNIFAGVKVASTLAIVGAVVGEFVAADKGLGYQLIVANGTMDISLSFAVLATLSILGILLFAAVDFCERLALPWHVSQRGMLSAGSRSA
jgi:NitT/TauT family transport system permease protein